MILAATSTSTNAWAAAGITLGLAAAILAYWLPTIIAWRRRVPTRGAVTVINVFLGWTVIGWIVALAMAVSGQSQPATPPSPGPAG